MAHHEIDKEELDYRLNAILKEENLEFPSTDLLENLPNPNSQPLSLNLEANLDLNLKNLMVSPSAEPKPEPLSPGSENRKKRGRKPIRPNDPIKKKTEEKDKYWLRVFRAYMKTRYSKLKPRLTQNEQLFWLEYLGPSGKPGKGNQFLSYGKRYKNFLFAEPIFVAAFRDWFQNHGHEDLSKKCKPGSDLWYVYYDYASKDLVNYIPHGASSVDSGDSPLSCTSPPELQESPFNDDIDFCMIGTDNDTVFDNFINQM
ncbi:unnamed protein product [Blepharisma stoltei]|uniref:Uncharacterized protein n=1 Tax=Blepharisma stoltei TaxID=1481888 RepID=A0AAU9JEZ6_9CILI|nr:unnamed protein product [Blepharisma stoltei]